MHMGVDITPAYALMPLCCVRARVCVCVGRQAELNERVRMQEFAIATRYPAVLMVLFVCFSYSSGMPLLVPIAFLSFFVFYWAEKILLCVALPSKAGRAEGGGGGGGGGGAFAALCSHMAACVVAIRRSLRATTRPPRFDATLANLTLQALPFAALFHTAIAVWMYSEPTVVLTEKHRDFALIRLRMCTHACVCLSASCCGLHSPVVMVIPRCDIHAVATMDPIGWTDRVLRINATPFTWFAALLFVWVLCGRLLLAAFLRFVYAVTAGRYGSMRFGVEDLRKQNPSFAGTFRKYASSHRLYRRTSRCELPLTDVCFWCVWCGAWHDVVMVGLPGTCHQNLHGKWSSTRQTWLLVAVRMPQRKRSLPRSTATASLRANAVPRPRSSTSMPRSASGPATRSVRCAGVRKWRCAKQEVGAPRRRRVVVVKKMAARVVMMVGAQAQARVQRVMMASEKRQPVDGTSQRLICMLRTRGATPMTVPCLLE